ncbi:MAG TPA: PIN domain-containing protein [Candidatus Bathyarchaeia archaeon]|nr:PIN domain-containing protein [Candidatus Bathyarchaeia archaeon]
MAVFVDTGVFVALRNADDELHARSKDLMSRALKGDFGRIYTSDYVIDEAVTTALVRTRRHDLAVDVGRYIIDSPRITKLWTTKDIFDVAWDKFKTFKDHPLSFSDCISLAHVKKNGIKQMMSFDSGFDGLAERLY